MLSDLKICPLCLGFHKIILLVLLFRLYILSKEFQNPQYQIFSHHRYKSKHLFIHDKRNIYNAIHNIQQTLIEQIYQTFIAILKVSKKNSALK